MDKIQKHLLTVRNNVSFIQQKLLHNNFHVNTSAEHTVDAPN